MDDRVEDVAIMRFVWRVDAAGREIDSLETKRMNQRFAARFREINRLIPGGIRLACRKKLDRRSAELFRRIKEEWKAVQPSL